MGVGVVLVGGVWRRAGTPSPSPSRRSRRLGRRRRADRRLVR